MRRVVPVAVLLLAVSASAAIHVSSETILLDRPVASGAMAFGPRPMLAWVERDRGGVFVAPIDALTRPITLPRYDVTAFVADVAIASDDRGYLAAWVESTRLGHLLVALRLGADGTPLTVLPEIVAALPLSTMPPLTLQLTFEDGRYVTQWKNVRYRIESSGVILPVRADSSLVVTQRSFFNCGGGFGRLCGGPFSFDLLVQLVEQGGVALYTTFGTTPTAWADIRTAVTPREILVTYGNSSRGANATTVHRETREQRHFFFPESPWVQPWTTDAGFVLLRTDARDRLVAATIAEGVLAEAVFEGTALSSATITPLGSDRLLIVYARALDGRGALVSRVVSFSTPRRTRGVSH